MQTNDNIDITALYILSQRFEHFSEMLGLRVDDELIEQIDSDERMIFVPQRDRDLVIAWVTMLMCAKKWRTIFWMTPKWREDSPVHSIMHHLVALKNTKMAPFVLTKNDRMLDLDNGTRLYVSPLDTVSMRGMSVPFLVLEGCMSGTRTWDKITAEMCQRVESGGRIIAIEKSYG